MVKWMEFDFVLFYEALCLSNKMFFMNSINVLSGALSTLFQSLNE